MRVVDHLICKPNAFGAARFLLIRVLLTPFEQEYKAIDWASERKVSAKQEEGEEEEQAAGNDFLNPDTFDTKVSEHDIEESL
ncbi:MAG: hypothetical protein Q9200_002835 [Gallowayella weberi]